MLVENRFFKNQSYLIPVSINIFFTIKDHNVPLYFQRETRNTRYRIYLNNTYYFSVYSIYTNKWT